MKKFLFNKLSLKEYNMLASAPFELTTETEKAVLVKFTTEKGTKSIWIPKSVLKDTQPAETNENNFLVKGQKYKHKIIGGNKMLRKIKEIVTEKEIERLDKVVEEIYDGEYADSAAYTLGFDTVTNLNGRGYENLVRIVDNLNYGRDDEDFARFILGKVFNSHKIEILKREIDTLDF